MVRSVGAGLCSARCSDEIGTRGRSRAPPLHGENPLPRSAGKGALFGGPSLSLIHISPIMAVWAVIKILGKSWTLSAVTAGFVVALVTLVLLIMSSCLPRFRRVQKKTCLLYTSRCV